MITAFFNATLDSQALLLTLTLIGGGNNKNNLYRCCKTKVLSLSIL